MIARRASADADRLPTAWRNSLLGAVVPGLSFVGMTAWTGLGASAVGLLLAVATGSSAVGIAFGFLFGVPTADPGQTSGRYLPNTSIEQTSDWLTKLIICATLVQLGSIGTALGSFFQSVAGSLGADVNVAIPGAIAIHFAVLGFLGSGLMTSAFSSADQKAAREMILEERELAARQREALNRGDVAEAESLRAERHKPLVSLEILAGNLDTIRQLESPGDSRTKNLEDV